jgi:hypothetical protein
MLVYQKRDRARKIARVTDEGVLAEPVEIVVRSFSTPQLVTATTTHHVVYPEGEHGLYFFPPGATSDRAAQWVDLASDLRVEAMTGDGDDVLMAVQTTTGLALQRVGLTGQARSLGASPLDAPVKLACAAPGACLAVFLKDGAVHAAPVTPAGLAAPRAVPVPPLP